MAMVSLCNLPPRHTFAVCRGNHGIGGAGFLKAVDIKSERTLSQLCGACRRTILLFLLPMCFGHIWFYFWESLKMYELI